jgi:hypothetical protein
MAVTIALDSVQFIGIVMLRGVGGEIVAIFSARFV